MNLDKLKKYNHFILLQQISMWLLIATVVGILSGTATAAFLTFLDWATRTRESQLWLIAFLPISGLLIGLIYDNYGSQVASGHNLLLDEIHDPKSVIPLRMAVLIFFGTIATHLFGGSAGREGTALQMGGSLADQISAPLGLGPEDRRILLMTGISAGFGSVFGTPLAGTIFGLEALAIGRLRYDAIFPCLIGAIVGDRVTKLWGIHHTIFHVSLIPSLTAPSLLLTILAGMIFGGVGMLFAKITHRTETFLKTRISFRPLRPFIGGCAIAAIILSTHATNYIGLGIPTIIKSFSSPLPPWSFGAKLALTSLTLGSGFKGGEVTPLFFIGATLGNALSKILALPMSLMAGLGFVSVFSGAANTPIAATFLAIELFGPKIGVFAAISCVTSYLFSGHSGIYSSQRIGQVKINNLPQLEGVTLAELDDAREAPLLLAGDVNLWGFTNRKESVLINDIAALRLYFRHGAKIKAEGVWGKLLAPSLGSHLMARAKAFGIDQVILQRVSAGFLYGDMPAHDISDIKPHRLPQCLEFVDAEEKLRIFLDEHRNELQQVRVVMLRCEDPLLYLNIDSEPELLGQAVD